MDILSIKMGENDPGAKTVRDYLKMLLTQLWEKEEGFSGKRPFGNSGWQHEVYFALIKAGAINGKIDEEHVYALEYDRKAADKIIMEAIKTL